MRHFIGLWLCLMLCSCFGKKPKITTGLEGKPVPDIELLAADSTTRYSTADIKSGKPTLLFSFETWCPYCKAELHSLISHITSLKNLNIYLICYSPFSEFKKFYNANGLNTYSNIKAGVDIYFSFPKYFKSGRVPYLAVYDEHKRLKRVIIGKASFSIIKHAVFD